MPPDEHRKLRDLLTRRAREVSQDAIRTDGAVTDEQVESLEALARLVELRSKSTAKRRLAVILIFIGTLLAASLLAFLPVTSVEVELDLAVSEVSFEIPREQALTSTMTVSLLGVTGLSIVDLPRARGRPGATYRAPSVFLAQNPDVDSTATITLNDLTLPAGTRVWLRATGSPYEYRLSFRGATAELDVTVDGDLRVTVPDSLGTQLEFTRPRPVALQTGADMVDIEFVPTVFPTAFVEQLPASNLHLFRIEEHEGASGTLVRQVSTIRSGSLFMESIRGEARPLRPGEGISFKTSAGEIRQLTLAEDHLLLSFNGRVQGLESGSGAVRHSLMPSLLEWLQARKPLTLLWAATLYMFTLVFGVLRWWRRSS
jgi:hypothetical protein